MTYLRKVAGGQDWEGYIGVSSVPKGFEINTGSSKIGKAGWHILFFLFFLCLNHCVIKKYIKVPPPLFLLARSNFLESNFFNTALLAHLIFFYNNRASRQREFQRERKESYL